MKTTDLGPVLHGDHSPIVEEGSNFNPRERVSIQPLPTRSIGIQDSDLAGVDPSTCDSIVDPEGRRPRIWFQVVPERKAAKNRVHLDLDVTRGRQGTLAERRRVVEVEVARLISLGA